MALDITSFQLLPVADYTRGLTDPLKIKTCQGIYMSVQSIDMVDLISRYNSLQYAHTAAELTSLNDLKSDIDMYYGMVNRLISTNTPDTTMPAVVMKGYLSTIRSHTESLIRSCSKSIKHPLAAKVTSAKEKIGKAKSTMHKVESAYKKLSGPADKLFDFTQGTIDKFNGRKQ